MLKDRFKNVMTAKNLKSLIFIFLFIGVLSCNQNESIYKKMQKKFKSENLNEFEFFFDEFIDLKWDTLYVFKNNNVDYFTINKTLNLNKKVHYEEFHETWVFIDKKNNLVHQQNVYRHPSVLDNHSVVFKSIDSCNYTIFCNKNFKCKKICNEKCYYLISQ
jgi:hypothetical protein